MSHLGLFQALLLAILVFACTTEANNRQKVKKKYLQTNRFNSRDPSIAVPAENGPCQLNGHWYNQHGSELYINQTNENQFCGEYRTAVEVDETSQNAELMGYVRGSVVGRLFTFSVYWKDGQSVTTWSGQCHKPCDMGYFSSDHTTLHTTWLLTSRQESCDRHWMSTRIGQDIFARDSTIKDGPRRDPNDATRA